MWRLACLILLIAACKPNLAHAQDAPVDAKRIEGAWLGEWSSYRGSGRLEFQIDSVSSTGVAGRVNSQAQECTIGWTPLSATIAGEEIRGSYTIGAPCGRVQVTFPLPRGNVIEGKWTSEARGWGTFRLTKQQSR